MFPLAAAAAIADDAAAVAALVDGFYSKHPKPVNVMVEFSDIQVGGDIFSYGNVSIDFPNGLLVGGVDVMAEISSEISRAEAAEASIAEELSTEVSYLIANTDLGSIDSFAEIVSDLSSEVERAESAEVSIDTAVNNLSTNTEDYVVANRPSMNGFYGAPDGVTTVFDADVISGTHIVFLNGLMQTIGSDYTATNASNGGITVTFNNAPVSTDTLRIYGVPSGTSFNGVNA